MSAHTDYPTVPPPLYIDGGMVGVGNPLPDARLDVTAISDGPDVLRVNRADGVRTVSIGTYPGDATLSAFWLGTLVPDGANYTILRIPGALTIINAPELLQIRINTSFSPVSASFAAAAATFNGNVVAWASGGLSVGSANAATDPGNGNVLMGGIQVGGSTGVAISKIRHSNATLVNGTVTVNDTNVLATSRIFVNRFTDSGTIGDSYSVTRIAATSFTITSKTAGVTQALDTSVVAWEMINP